MLASSGSSQVNSSGGRETDLLDEQPAQIICDEYDRSPGGRVCGPRRVKHAQQLPCVFEPSSTKDVPRLLVPVAKHHDASTRYSVGQKMAGPACPGRMSPGGGEPLLLVGVLDTVNENNAASVSVNLLACGLGKIVFTRR